MELPIDQEAAAFPEVVRTKTFFLEPMTLEDALEQVPCSIVLLDHYAPDALEHDACGNK